ncbi:MAG: hypothetical protein KJ592_03055 [Nanoarchaeota archaeon]|nr:hypothetical protein [Nanoarchaeota archaeon]
MLGRKFLITKDRTSAYEKIQNDCDFVCELPNDPARSTKITIWDYADGHVITEAYNEKLLGGVVFSENNLHEIIEDLGLAKYLVEESI